jgi:wobble nucleotide-excising tRNase
MTFAKSEDLDTLAQAREAYDSLLSVHQATVIDRAKEMAALEKANQELDALRGDLKAANEMLDEANTSIGSLTGQVKESREKEQTLGNELKGSKDAISTLEQKVSKLEAEAKSAEAKAAEICASVGVEPAQVTPGGEEKQQSLVEQLREIKNPAEQMAFFRKHREEIIRER